jgi:hypothetical protein
LTRESLAEAPDLTCRLGLAGSFGKYTGAIIELRVMQSGLHNEF